jgi:beta-lactam-binding protein with PASTA domain
MSFFKKLGNFIISRTFWFNIVLILLFWVGLIWGTLNYFDSYTRKGEEVEVPTFLYNNISDASALIGNSDLKYEVVDSLYNPDLVEGTVIYQDPLPTDSTNVKVKKGRVVMLRVSKQSRLVEIPLVLSRSERFAKASLNAKGLRTKINYVPSVEDQGSVVAQKYKSQEVVKGMKVPINSVIQLDVGERAGVNLVLIPDLSGLTIKESEERFKRNRSLKLFTVCTDCETAQDSLMAKVVRQTPVASDSSKAPVGSTITIFAKVN